MGVKVVAIGPLEAVTHGEGVGFAVSGDINFLSCVGNQLHLLVVGHQTREGVNRHDRAVNCRVEGRIDVLGLT